MMCLASFHLLEYASFLCRGSDCSFSYIYDGFVDFDKPIPTEGMSADDAPFIDQGQRVLGLLAADTSKPMHAAVFIGVCRYQMPELIKIAPIS